MNAISILAIIHCALIAVITRYELTIASRAGIAGVGGAGIIIVAVYSDMAASCQRITGIGSAGIAVITFPALDI